MSDQALTAAMIGCYQAGGETQFLPVSRVEMDRAQNALFQVIKTFGIASRRVLLSLSRSRDCAFTIPFERAAYAANLIVCNADDTPFEAVRVESFLRRFDVAAVAGLSSGGLDGLADAGHDVDRLFAGKVVWARGGAYERLAGRPGLIARRWMEVGPALAVECAEGKGAHIDAVEWDVAESPGGLVISSRLARLQTFEDQATGFAARIDWRPCGCGSIDPRIVVD
jgi:hypothetical protein